MPPIALAVNKIVPVGLADPAGVAGATSGHKVVNDGKTFLRVANAAPSANAVWTISAGSGTVTAGAYQFIFQIGPHIYTTAAIASGTVKAAVAAAVLAAVRVSGTGTVALSADYPAGTVTGAGTDLPTGPITLTFGGTLAHVPAPVPAIDDSTLTGGTYVVTLTTPGTGTGTISILVPGTHGGQLVDPVRLSVPGAGAVTWFGPWSQSLVNQPAGTTDAGSMYVVYDVPANYTVTAFST